MKIKQKKTEHSQTQLKKTRPRDGEEEDEPGKPRGCEALLK